MSKWSEIYTKQMSEFNSLDAFIDNKIAYKKELIDVIKKYSTRTRRLLEVGCGSGITSIFLEQAGYIVVGIDSDSDMVNLATSIATQLKSSALFLVDDIKILKIVKNQHFDVIYSNGVMEHFSDENIIPIVNLHLSVSDYVIISIPSDYFSDDQRMYGNERFMSTSQWKSILSKTRGSIIEEFAFDSDKVTGSKPQFIGFVLSST